jgi:AraC-like DNA-binding protein
MSSNRSELRVISELDHMEFLHARLEAFRFPVHFHETLVIQWVQSGADWCCVNHLTANRDEIFVHFPRAAHSGGTYPDGRVEYRAIYPSVELVSELIGIPVSKLPTGQSFVLNSRGLVEQVKEFFASLEPVKDEADLREKLKSVLLAVLEPRRLSVSAQRKDNVLCKLESAREYLVQHADRDISVAELSQYCGLSKFHLIRSFKEAFGITPRRFLISQRVTMAKELVLAGLPLVQAAYSAGFNDQSHLTRCFKRLTTFSPGQFKSAASKTTKPQLDSEVGEVV